MFRLSASVWPYRIVRWLLAGVFLWAGVVKAADPGGFAATISDFGLVPESVLFVTAVSLIGLELLAAVGLVFDIRGAVGLTAVLLAVFIGVLAYGLAIGLDIECGCFGPGYRETGLWDVLWRDLVLLAACGYLWWFRWISGIRPLALRGLWQRLFSEKGSTKECVP
jgi:hypothetical protein